jgi:7-carboxy-7-deazaguanine synthase
MKTDHQNEDRFLRINEIFYSIQGEGARAGEPSVFVRLSGCDLACGFCDTEFESGKAMSLDELRDRILQWPCRWIVWTGGEPMLQVTEEVISYFHAIGFSQAIESNGNHRIPRSLDWIVVSPKVAEHVLKRNFPDGVDELRYVRHSGHTTVPQPSVTARVYYLSPIFDGNTPNWENVRHCMKLAQENPRWRISLQLHKLLGVL